MSTCRICGKNTSAFSLEMKAEDGEEYTLPVCGTCWDIIAEIAHRQTKELYKHVAELERKVERIIQAVPSSG